MELALLTVSAFLLQAEKVELETTVVDEMRSHGGAGLRGLKKCYGILSFASGDVFGLYWVCPSLSLMFALFEKS